MLRMTIAAALCLASVPLAGCTTPTAGTSYSKARMAVERAAAAYARVRARADAVLPYLPQPYRGRIEDGLALADAALAVARDDVTPEERELALHKLAAAVADIVSALMLR